MSQHSIDDVYAQVADIKKKLEATAKEKPKEEPKKEPSQIENWAKLIGMEEVVKAVQDLKVSSIATWSTLSAVVIGFLASNIIDKEALTTSLLKKRGYTRDDTGIPRKNDSAASPLQAPITSIDIDRLKAMRSTSIALSRSLNDLTKDVRDASREIA
ncbi:hypothetical protein [Streptomyces umbrinus]|jgi:hypothetical protein|uniref:hypothetical protein n=1 Tax=Streptomyces umbrinus TaxID=67370 RepID=UPI00167A8E38|nr:hypothetical protein [Streptomyces umbrinus]MCX4559104.1 hypothetical protein [Streptomyces phaeochromogenes]GHB77204.1 hypothetical protein GCM10010306_084080 [Streptomyces umbrinus]